MFALAETPSTHDDVLRPEPEIQARHLTPTMKSLEWHDPEPVLKTKTMSPIPATVEEWKSGSSPSGYLKLSQVPSLAECDVQGLSLNSRVYVDGLSLLNESGRGNFHTPRPGETVYVYAFGTGIKGPRVERALTEIAHEQFQANEVAKLAAQAKTEEFVNKPEALQEVQRLLQERLQTTPLLKETSIPNLRKEEPILHCKLRAFSVAHDPQSNCFTADIQADFSWVTYRPQTQVDRSADLVIENILPPEHTVTTRFMSVDNTPLLAGRFNEQGEFKVVYPVLGKDFELWHAVQNAEFRSEPAARDQQLQHVFLQFTVETPLGPKLVKILVHEPSTSMYDAFTIPPETLPTNLRDSMTAQIERVSQANQEIHAQQVLPELEKRPVLEKPTPENTVVTLTKRDYVPAGAAVTPEQRDWLTGMGTQLAVQVPAKQRGESAYLSFDLGGVLPDLSQGQLEGQRGFQKWPTLVSSATTSFHHLQQNFELLDEVHRHRLLQARPELQFSQSEAAFAEYCQQIEAIVKQKLQVVYPNPLPDHQTLGNRPPAGISREVLVAVTNLNNKMLSLTSAEASENRPSTAIFPASLGYAYEYQGQKYRLPPLIVVVEGKQVRLTELGQTTVLTWDTFSVPLVAHCHLYSPDGQPLKDEAGKAVEFPLELSHHVATWEGDDDSTKSSVTLSLTIKALPELPLKISVTPPPEKVNPDLPYAERIKRIFDQADVEPQLKALLSIDSLATAQDRIDSLIHDREAPLELVSLLNLAKQLVGTIDRTRQVDWGLTLTYHTTDTLMRSLDETLDQLRNGKNSEAGIGLSEVKTVLRAIQTKLRNDSLLQSGNRVSVELKIANDRQGYTQVAEYLSLDGREITNFTTDRKTQTRTYLVIPIGSVLAKVEVHPGPDFSQIITVEVPQNATLNQKQLAAVEQLALKQLEKQYLIFELQLAQLGIPLRSWQTALQRLTNAPAGIHTLSLTLKDNQPQLLVTHGSGSPEAIPLEKLPAVAQPHTKDELLKLADNLMQAVKGTPDYQQVANRIIQIRRLISSFSTTAQNLGQVERLLLDQAEIQGYNVTAASYVTTETSTTNPSPLKTATPLGLARADIFADEEAVKVNQPGLLKGVVVQAMTPPSVERRKPTDKTKADVLLDQLAQPTDNLLSTIMAGKLQHDSRPWTLAIAAVLTRDFDSIYKLLKYNFVASPNGNRQLSNNSKFTIKDVQTSLTDIINKPEAKIDTPADQIIEKATNALKRLTVYQYLAEAFFDPAIREWIGTEDADNEKVWMNDVFDQLIELSDQGTLPVYTQNNMVLQNIISQTVENKL